MSDIALQELLDKEVLFARMAPEHKMRLVSAFQQRGEVVAVTGDGVNDAPALAQSGCGHFDGNCRHGCGEGSRRYYFDSG